MKNDLDMRVNFLERYHRKHAKAIVNAAQDDLFKNYFTATSGEEKKRIKSEIDQLSLAVQERFSVDEMCLIDNAGHEISRIVFKEIAPDEDLSHEEHTAPFFKASLAQAGRQVHIQEPYLSADSLRWVICYTTPIVLDEGSQPGFYHFEMPMYAVQEAVNNGLEADEDNYVLIVDRDRFVVSDSRKKLPLDLKADPGQTEQDAIDASTPARYFPRLSDSDLGGAVQEITSGQDGSSTYTSGGQEYLVAYKPTEQLGWSIVLVAAKESSATPAASQP